MGRIKCAKSRNSGAEQQRNRAGGCASACVFAFMGGTERMAGPEGRLGVHQFYQVGEKATATSEDIQQIAGLILLHTLRMGIDPTVMAAASLTPPDQMYWFSLEEKRESGLNTADNWFDAWSIEPYRNGLVLTSVYHESVRRSANITVFCRGRGDWFILISEPNNHLAGTEILQMQGPVRNRPRLRIGDNTVEIDARNIEFQRWQGSRAFVSIKTESRLADQAGKTIAFDPDFPRYKGSFLAFRIDLPDTDWLAVARRNCI